MDVNEIGSKCIDQGCPQVSSNMNNDPDFSDDGHTIARLLYICFLSLGQNKNAAKMGQKEAVGTYTTCIYLHPH